MNHLFNYIKRILFLIFFISFTNTEQVLSDPHDWMEEANQKIPHRAKNYTPPEFQTIFKDYVHPEIRQKFNDDLEGDNLLKSKPSNVIIVDAYQYLYTKIRDAHQLNEEKKKERQIEYLTAFHAIPHREAAYTHSELQIIFKNHFHPEIMQTFDLYFAIMLQKDFPKPKHSNQVIVNGYQCLLTKIWDTRKLDDNEKKERQLKALYELLSLHKQLISKFNQELGEKIPNFGCDQCKKSATINFGIKQHTGYAEQDQ